MMHKTYGILIHHSLLLHTGVSYHHSLFMIVTHRSFPHVLLLVFINHYSLSISLTRTHRSLVWLAILVMISRPYSSFIIHYCSTQESRIIIHYSLWFHTGVPSGGGEGGPNVLAQGLLGRPLV